MNKELRNDLESNWHSATSSMFLGGVYGAVFMRKSYLENLTPERREQLNNLMRRLLQLPQTEIPKCGNCGRRVACGKCCENPLHEDTQMTCVDEVERNA